MSTVKERYEKKRKYSIKDGDSERHGIKTFTGFKLEAIGPYRSPEKSPSAPMDSKQAEFSQLYLFLISKIKY